MRTVLVTGSSGRIGQAFFSDYQESTEFVLTDLREPEHPIVGQHRFVQSDLSDAFRLIPTFVHIAASVEWGSLPTSEQ